MGRFRTGSGLSAGAPLRALALFAALVTLLLALAPAADAAGPADVSAQPGFHALGRTVVSAIASTTNADEALSALSDGLAMIEARQKVAAAAAREAAPAPMPPTAAEVAADPSKLPAASAGSNGTSIPRHDAAEAQKIFAHSRGASGESTSILLTGIALPPPDAPEAVQRVIDNANSIVGRPYIWGGGHGSFYSYGYDCSGSVSFALFGGGLIPRPLTSSELEGWGDPGPGKWITVYANASHTFAEIAGLRWDTVGDENGTGPRWHLAPTSSAGFVVRHPPGL
jgi:cell wall-associated NlpC family hydrolase